MHIVLVKMFSRWVFTNMSSIIITSAALKLYGVMDDVMT